MRTLLPSLRSLLLAAFALLCVLPLDFAHAQSGAAQPGPASRVYVGLYVHDISNLSLGAGTYEIDADVWVKWYGRFNPDEIRFTNAADIEREVLERSSDGDWHAARWRLRGTLRGEFPVQNFPLDRQTLGVDMELPRALGELVPDLAGSGIATRFSITDWSWSQDFRPIVTTERYPSDLGSLADEGRSAEVRRVRFEVALQRPLLPVLLKLFLPLGIVALIVYLSLYVPPDTLQPRLTMCVTGLVACFAFQFSVADVMPAVAYLTLTDVLFITVYLLAIFCVAVAVLEHFLLATKQPSQAKKLQVGARVVVPVLMGLTIFSSLPATPAAPATERAELPDLQRPASSRPLLRIGTTSPLRVASSPIGAAAFWGLTYDDGLRAQPLHIDRMPRIDSDLMRFHADGTLAVTWRLREGARWSDGRPLSTEDLTLPLQIRPDPRVLAVEVLDERTVVLTWGERVVDAVRAPELWPSAHIHAHLDPHDADALNRYLGYAPRPSTGPFKVQSVSEERIVASRNPHFPLTPAPLEQIEVIYYPDSAALRRALEQGEIDLTTPNALSLDDLLALQARDHIKASQTPSHSFVFLATPLRAAPFDAPEVRRALLSGLDRARLAEEEWGAAGRPASLPRQDAPFDPESSPYTPEDSRRILSAHGLEGHPIPLRWSPPLSEDFALAVAEQLEALGLSPQVERVPSTWPIWLSQENDGLLLHSLRVERGQDPRQWWALPTVASRIDSTDRHAAYTDELHALMDQREHAFFRERREQLQARVEEAWLDTLPLLPLVFAGERIAAEASLRGWDTPSDGLFGDTLDQWAFE